MINILIDGYIGSKYNTNCSDAQISGWISGGIKRTGKTKHNDAGRKSASIKMFGRTKDNDNSRMVAANKIKGRKTWNFGLNKENNTIIATMAENSKGRIPWNKGLTKGNNEIMFRISQKLTGREGYCKGLTNDNCEWLRKKSNDAVGRESKTRGRTKHDNQGILLISQKLSGRTKETHSYLMSMSDKLRGRTKFNDESVASMAKKMTGRTKQNNAGTARGAEKQKLNVGEKSHNWLGGISFLPYSSEFNRIIKEYIKDRDDYICQKCGISEIGYVIKSGKKYGLACHHINYDKMDCNENNLISLCHSCHSKTNNLRDFWQVFLHDKLLMNKLHSAMLIYG